MSERSLAQPVPKLESACLRALFPQEENLSSVQQRCRCCAGENGLGFDAAFLSGISFVFCGFSTPTPKVWFVNPQLGSVPVRAHHYFLKSSNFVSS